MEKDISLFVRRKNSYGGYCKECDSARAREYRKTNVERVRMQKKRYRESHLEEITEIMKQYYKDNFDRLKAEQKKRRAANPEKNREAARQWREANPERCKELRRNYKRKRRANDPAFRLLENLRSRVLIAIKKDSGEKAYSTIELIGCNVQDLRKHLESKFTEGMSWDNMGVGGWEVDHKKPCAKFNLEDPEEQKKCFHWTNLQPLWALDNLRKGDKWEDT